MSYGAALFFRNAGRIAGVTGESNVSGDYLGSTGVSPLSQKRTLPVYEKPEPFFRAEEIFDENGNRKQGYPSCVFFGVKDPAIEAVKPEPKPQQAA